MVKFEIRKFIKLILLIVFAVSFAMFVYNQYQSMDAQNAYEQAESIANETTEATTSVTEATTEATAEETTEEEAKPLIWQEAPVEDDDSFILELAEKNLGALREVNADVLGWIEIPGTQLAYPIMDGNDNEYYLEHTWDKQPSAAGSVFLEQLNNSDLRDFNTLIYGHRMMNGSMFGSLKYFNTNEHYEKHPYVYILDDSGVHRYEIFSAYTAPVEGAAFVYGFHNEEGMQLFLDYCMSNSEIDTGVVPTVDDKILTLVTCTGRGYEARWVVQARLKGVEGNPKRFYEKPTGEVDATQKTTQ
ncbi:MAG: class B sortase [Lachnoclostridium sp.]|nr:class B sortase [Lachnoclostridium sp.]